MNLMNPINPLPLLHKRMRDKSFYLYYQKDLVQRYENLRSQVLEDLNFTSRPAMRAMGYVLFLRQGMLVWMENCATSATSVLEPGMTEISDADNNDYNYKEKKDIPEYLKEQLVFALTNIVVDYQRRMERIENGRMERMEGI